MTIDAHQIMCYRILNFIGLECYTCTARIYRLGAESNDLEITVQESLLSELACFRAANAARKPTRRLPGLIFRLLNQPTSITGPLSKSLPGLKRNREVHFAIQSSP